MNVLIVDDSKIVRRVLSNTLPRLAEKLEWPTLNLFEAEDGLVAIEQMKNNDIDIILLDWNMPNMNGEEVVDTVRSNKAWNKTRIIMATTEGGKDNVIKMIKKGANGYMVKPFKEDAILKTLQTVSARMPKK
jgi:two-component system chemotaxis response regulator CheY